MQLKKEDFCPLLKKDCIGLKCAWFTKIEGYNINTGERVDEWQCSMTLIPMLLIENSGMQRQTGAAVESFRNEMVKSNESAQELFKTMAINALEHSKKPELIKIEEEK